MGLKSRNLFSLAKKKNSNDKKANDKLTNIKIMSNCKYFTIFFLLRFKKIDNTVINGYKNILKP